MPRFGLGSKCYLIIFIDRLLKESLGGNSKTAMLATIGPSNFHVDETLSTLRYAKQARSIINQAKVNEDPKAKLIRGKVCDLFCVRI